MRSIHVTLPRARPALALPADAAITQTFGILARKEGGKTYLAQLMAGAMLNLGAQVVALDPVTKWWALRLDRRGKPYRRPRGKDVYILGGKRGDFPLAPDKGKLVAKLVVEKRISVVLDTTFMRKYQRHKFLAEFGEEFLHLKQIEDDPFPVHVFVEEAQTVMPQQRRAGDKDIDRMLGAWEDIARLGRNAGIGITMISQRPQSVNKEALSQVECLFALGVNEVPGRQAIERWVQEKGAEREIIGELPGLDKGEAIVWSPSWLKFFGRVKIGEKDTYDASASARLGRRRRRVGKLGKVDVRALTLEEVDELGQDDPVRLRGQVRERDERILRLEGALKKMQAQLDVTPAPLARSATAKTVKVPVLKDAHVRRLDHALGRLMRVQVKISARELELEKVQKLVHNAVGDLRNEISHARIEFAGVGKPVKLAEPVGVTMPNGVKLPLRVQPKAKPPPRTDTASARYMRDFHPDVAARLASESSNAPTAPQLRLVAAIAQSPGGASRGKLSVLLGHKRSYRDLLLRQVTAMGFIGRDGDRFRETPAGLAALGEDFRPLPTGQALRDHWLQALPGGEQKVFSFAVQAYPNAVEIDALDEKTGFKRSYRDLCIRQLRAREIITKEGRSIRAAEELFQ